MAPFGSAGKVTTDFGANDVAGGLALAADGRVVVAGGSPDFEVARYQTDGSLDPTFDGDGKVTTDSWGRPTTPVAVWSSGRPTARSWWPAPRVVRGGVRTE